MSVETIKTDFTQWLSGAGSNEWTLIKMLHDASPVVLFIMGILVMVSLVSWWVIFRKSWMLGRARRAANSFEDSFWSGIDLSSLYNRLERRRGDVYGMEAIFSAGFQEFMRLRSQAQGDYSNTIVDGSQRAMRAALAREIDELEAYLPMLASSGSTSPYIGLFGTVWGIMNSFVALADVQHATLTQVAPGIAEALVATAMGLFAAIPATMAYNRYAHEVDRLINRYDTFMEEFSNVLQRQVYVLRKNQKIPSQSS